MIDYFQCVRCESLVLPGENYVEVFDDDDRDGVMCLNCAVKSNHETGGGFLGVRTMSELVASDLIKTRPPMKSREKSVKNLPN